MAEVYGCRSMVAKLRRVLVKRPDAAFDVEDIEKWHYKARPDLGTAQREHDSLVEILCGCGAEVIYHDEPQPGRADAIYVHDPAIISDRGAIILRMGKELRRGEEDALARRFERLGVPIHYRLHGEATAEGGDLMWTDERTLAVGLGTRTNAEGMFQLQEALPGVEIVLVELPELDDPDACLHLMSSISLVDNDLAAIYQPLLPEPFRLLLAERGFRFVDVPDGEFETMATNVLALAPRDCLMIEGNPVTKKRLENAGCRVQTYRGYELSLKSEGGPTCLTRPILRG